MTSTILPFTSMNKFSNTAMAQEMGYYDDVHDNSDINYNIDEIYSDSPNQENKYECQKGPLEGFFVSSVEFCKRMPMIDDEGNKRETQDPSGPKDQTDSTEINANKLYTVIGNTTFNQK